MEILYYSAASVGLSVVISYWLTRRAIARIPKVEPKSEIHVHRHEKRMDMEHPFCGYCSSQVARYKFDSDNKIICANCAHERNV